MLNGLGKLKRITNSRGVDLRAPQHGDRHGLSPALCGGRSEFPDGHLNDTASQSADERHRNEHKKTRKRCAHARCDGSDELIRISQDQPVYIFQLQVIEICQEPSVRRLRERQDP